MRYALLLLATFITLVTAASIQLKQATRDEIARRMASPVQRRQSLPSAGVYPLCEGSLPRGTAGAMVASIVIGYEIGGTTLGTIVPRNNRQCANSCLNRSDCAGATLSLAGNICTLRSTTTNYSPVSNVNAIVVGRTCAAAQAIIGMSCCDYLVSG